MGIFLRQSKAYPHIVVINNEGLDDIDYIGPFESEKKAAKYFTKYLEWDHLGDDHGYEWERREPDDTLIFIGPGFRIKAEIRRLLTPRS